RARICRASINIKSDASRNASPASVRPEKTASTHSVRRFEVERTDQRFQPLAFVCEVRAELFRRNILGLRPQLHEEVPDSGFLYCTINFLVEARDNVGGRIEGCQHAPPFIELKAGQAAFGKGRDVGRSC